MSKEDTDYKNKMTIDLYKQIADSKNDSLSFFDEPVTVEIFKQAKFMRALLNEVYTEDALILEIISEEVGERVTKGRAIELVESVLMEYSCKNRFSSVVVSHLAEIADLLNEILECSEDCPDEETSGKVPADLKQTLDEVIKAVKGKAAANNVGLGLRNATETEFYKSFNRPVKPPLSIKKLKNQSYLILDHSEHKENKSSWF